MLPVYIRQMSGLNQSRTQSNACARARMALALGKLNFSWAVIGLMCMPTKPEPLNLGVPVVNFPRANAILARAHALLWVRDWGLTRILKSLIEFELSPGA